MKRTLLSFIVALLAVVGVSAQEWTWGTAKWNIEDGAAYEGIEEFNEKGGVVLSYPEAEGLSLTFLNMIAVDYNVYVDDAAEPIPFTSSAQMSTEVRMNFGFSEGHKYRLVTTGAVLAQANLATYTTDTLSTNTDSYSISFSIDGPTLVKTLNVEANMSLSIIDQNYELTFSEVDTVAIKNALGISYLSEARVYGLNLDGSYIEKEYYSDYFDGWRDADGDYTNYNGGWDSYHGHNAYPAVYCIKLNETADTISYFFYDRWREYNPDEDTTLPGSGVEGTEAKAKAPTTSYNSVVWDWKDDEGNVTQYTRSYRCDEGSDYKGSFVYIANKKYVKLNATLHFLSQDDYAAGIENVAAPANAPVAEGIYSLSGARLNSLQKGINIVKSADGSTRKVLVK